MIKKEPRVYSTNLYRKFYKEVKHDLKRFHLLNSKPGKWDECINTYFDVCSEEDFNFCMRHYHDGFTLKELEDMLYRKSRSLQDIRQRILNNIILIGVYRHVVQWEDIV